MTALNGQQYFQTLFYSAAYILLTVPSESEDQSLPSLEVYKIQTDCTAFR